MSRPTRPRAPLEEQKVGLIIRRFFSTNFLLRCPNCGKGKVTQGFFGVKNRCDVCNANLNRAEDGNWLVASTLNFFFTGVISLLLMVYLISTYGYSNGLAAIIFTLVVLIITLVYRPAKVMALWILWVFGYIY